MFRQYRHTGGHSPDDDRRGVGQRPRNTVPGAAGSLQDTFLSVLARVRPSVVEISTTEGLGSGVVYDDQGDIVTNAHVVGSATSFKVSLVNGRTSPAPSSVATGPTT